MGAAKAANKRAAKRLRQKQNKAKLKEEEEKILANLKKATEEEKVKLENEEEEVKYVTSHEMEQFALRSEFAKIFERFAKPEELTAPRVKEEEGLSVKDDSASDFKGDTQEQPVATTHETEDVVISNKQRKLASRLTIAELKQLVDRPETVETHDCNSSDPKLLVHLKSYINTVPVPSHWCQRRAYLQGKRGFEKPLWELPAFIAATGIAEIRQHQADKDAATSLKQKLRQKVQPKMGKIDIDYQVLHEAFFRHQTKPYMTDHGALYYEGKEFEVKLKSKTPGQMSEELKRALGMGSDIAPPPWLYNMQRFGPPPSYPKMKIPGVNTPIPPGARYGIGPGEWGKPPVDEYGMPLYGDVFGTERGNLPSDEGLDKERWGQIQEEEEEEEDEEEDEDEDEDEDDEDEDAADMESTMESMASMASGVEEPEVLQLRKQTATEDSANRSLYQVLEEKGAHVGQGQLFGSQHTYVVPKAPTEQEKRLAEKKAAVLGEVQMSLNPEDLDTLDATTLKRKYDAQMSSKGKKDTTGVQEALEEGRAKKRKTADSNKKYNF